MDHGTNGDVGNGQRVAGLNVSRGGRHNGISSLQANRSQDITLLGAIVNQSDECAAVGIVLQAEDSAGHVNEIPLEVDDSVLSLVAAAMMTNGDSAVAVTASVLLEGLHKAALRFRLLINAIETGYGHVSARRRGRLKSFNSHD